MPRVSDSAAPGHDSPSSAVIRVAFHRQDLCRSGEFKRLRSVKGIHYLERKMAVVEKQGNSGAVFAYEPIELTYRLCA